MHCASQVLDVIALRVTNAALPFTTSEFSQGSQLHSKLPRAGYVGDYIGDSYIEVIKGDTSFKPMATSFETCQSPVCGPGIR